MNRLKNIIFGIIVITIFFTSVEAISRLFVFPGSYDFIERCMIEQKLPRHKNKSEFRIFLYGESTMQGHYLYPYSTIDKWLRLYLKDLLPGRISDNVRIINFGRIGSGSRFITTAFIDTIKYSPDLAVFYSANNDFCLFGNRREYFSKKSAADKLEDFGKELPRHSAFLNSFNRIVIRSKMKRSKVRDARTNKLDQWYQGDGEDPIITDEDLLYMGSDKYNSLMMNFQKNIMKAVNAAKRHSVPILFLESVAKLKGYEPVKSIHDPKIGRDELDGWEKAFADGERALKDNDLEAALASYIKCVDIDPSYALTYYRVGECYEGLEDPGMANKFYSIANDLDRYPIRAPSAVNRFYETLRGRDAEKIFILPTQKFFESHSKNGIVDDNLIGDQIHPAIDGQALIALEIARLIYDKELLASRAEWRWDRLRPVEEMKLDLKLDKAGESDTYLALAAYVKRDYPKATAFLEKALAMKADSVFINSWLAWAYWKLGERDKAVAIYRELYRAKPSLAAEFFKRHPEIREAVGG